MVSKIRFVMSSDCEWVHNTSVSHPPLICFSDMNRIPSSVAKDYKSLVGDDEDGFPAMPPLQVPFQTITKPTKPLPFVLPDICPSHSPHMPTIVSQPSSIKKSKTKEHNEWEQPVEPQDVNPLTSKTDSSPNQARRLSFEKLQGPELSIFLAICQLHPVYPHGIPRLLVVFFSNFTSAATKALLKVQVV